MERGDHDSLLAADGEYASLWRKQTRDTGTEADLILTDNLKDDR